MSGSSSFPHPLGAKAIEVRASSWVIERRTSDNWTVDDQASLEAWLNESTAHAIAYWRLNHGWERTYRLTALRHVTVERNEENRTPRTLRAFIGVAAIVALAITLGVGAHLLRSQPKYIDYATPIGGHRVVALADGSQIELNTDTSLGVSLREGSRTVKLYRGEAYFQIKHNAVSPFVVMAGKYRVTDLGTKFLVRSDADQLEVKLVEGRARLDFPGAQTRPSVDLTPGSVVVTRENSIVLTKVPVHTVLNELSWRQGVLVFNRTPLANAAAEINRYNDQKIILADTAIERMKIDGTFPSGNVKLFAHLAQLALKLHVENQGNQIVISR